LNVNRTPECNIRGKSNRILCGPAVIPWSGAKQAISSFFLHPSTGRLVVVVFVVDVPHTPRHPATGRSSWAQLPRPPSNIVSDSTLAQVVSLYRSSRVALSPPSTSKCPTISQCCSSLSQRMLFPMTLLFQRSLEVRLITSVTTGRRKMSGAHGAT